MSMSEAQDPSGAGGRPPWRLAIHGGCGILERDRITPEEDRAIRAALARALDVGGALLDAGGSALDAVEASARSLEDDPHFNAGHGSVYTFQGTIEMDAAIMEGAGRGAGAVCGVTATRNPVSLARAVMERSPHVLLSGAGADEFSRLEGLEQAPPDYFATEARRRQLDLMRRQPGSEWFDIDVKYGTIGAVALDRDGHVAAATSTGGLTGKRCGRIGDSPVIGAGTYADDRAGAISTTGAGEYFLRTAAAHEICARLRHAAGSGEPVGREQAQAIADSVLAEIEALGGSGGLILVTRAGDAIFSFTTAGMYRGEAFPNGRAVAIYGDEALA